MTPFDLSGEVALITGASSGLGRHMAGVLARAGARVALTARRLDRLDQAVGEIARDGGQALAVAMDVTDRASVVDGFTATEESLGRPTIVVNNAGIALTEKALELTESDWRTVLDTNLTGAWLVAQEAARRMSQGEPTGGSLINIASILGLRPTAGVAPYAAAKAGLIHLTQVLALEWARHNVRVNALAPGYVETEINRDFFATEAGQKLIRRIPQRRLGQPRDLDGALLLLASPASAYITGATLPIDGGHLCAGL
ncbi:SDR family NAD(P)-dependent oxidoreductase [Roseospirillum parvum]|uniref:NAD(P)-dependent dehydrogenase, short-chain alcohol dehydrogenase family n=1 Tax=Roseospirillum parvum TaxID=83401 RepID=A0A1G7WZF2_9PROT|nr:SDR family NAD(P)-dependent oxidoreductase [Roseospirillum parvum]SDG77285.1 NAD(P)-dependent dehydrogenase, short-chain alcohol dehydrogenase family [Roseospirillum parvum]